MAQLIESNPPLRRLLKTTRRRAESMLIEDVKLPRVVAETLVQVRNLD